MQIVGHATGIGKDSSRDFDELEFVVDAVAENDDGGDFGRREFRIALPEGVEFPKKVVGPERLSAIGITANSLEVLKLCENAGILSQVLNQLLFEAVGAGCTGFGEEDNSSQLKSTASYFSRQEIRQVIIGTDSRRKLKTAGLNGLSRLVDNVFVRCKGGYNPPVSPDLWRCKWRFRQFLSEPIEFGRVRGTDYRNARTLKPRGTDEFC